MNKDQEKTLERVNALHALVEERIEELEEIRENLADMDVELAQGPLGRESLQDVKDRLAEALSNLREMRPIKPLATPKPGK